MAKEEIITLQDALIVVGGIIVTATEKLKTNPVEGMYWLMMLNIPIIEEWFENTGFADDALIAEATNRVAENYGLEAVRQAVRVLADRKKYDTLFEED